MEYVRKPVTYRAVQYLSGKTDEEITKLLTGAKVRSYENAWIEYYPPPYREAGYVENGKKVQLWHGEWVVVSSLGEVSVESDEDFKKEFEEA